jgi:hypothetical protein
MFAGWQRRAGNDSSMNRSRCPGRRLLTLRDAGNCVTKLPKAEHDAEEWQAAMEALRLVAELGGPTMFAHRRHAGIEPPLRTDV